MRPGWWTAIDKGIAFLATAQQPDGSFASATSKAQKPFRTHVIRRTTRVPAVVLVALATVEGSQAQIIRDHLAAWLMTQKSPEWSCNYWASDAPERTTLPCADNLNDTFCTLIGLHLHDQQRTDSACLAKMVRLLIATESQIGGPYHTWLPTNEAPLPWPELDLVVNSNVAYFLNLVAKAPPNVVAYLEHAIASSKLASRHYPSWHAVAYYLSRVCTGPHRQQLIDYILQRRLRGYWGTPLKTGLALSALLALGYTDELETAATYVVNAQLPDGSWPAEAFCLEPAQDAQKRYCGSSALSTALITEALSGFKRLNAAPLAEHIQTKSIKMDAVAQKIYTSVMATARSQCKQLKPPLRSLTLNMLKRMDNSGHNQEIVLLPLLFARSLRTQPNLGSLPLLPLGLANLYGWMAYTIYDDFLDDEGDPKLLSVANVALRYSLANFKNALPNHTLFQHKVLATFDKIDAANAWEVTHCRASVHHSTIHMPSPMPVYQTALTLAERSLGHILTPFGILASQGIDLESAPAGNIERAFKHYLTARQLNDDLHDWRQDTTAGHCTYVVTNIYKQLAIPGTKQSLKQLLPRMQHGFWNHTLLPVCKIMSAQTALARQAADSSMLLTTPNVITELTASIDTSIRLTQEEHHKATTFLSAYSS